MLRAKKILEKKGKTNYWLYKHMDMSYQNFTKIINNQIKSIQCSNIEDLCVILECEPKIYFNFKMTKQLIYS